MKAVVCRRYGPPEVLEVVEVEKPAVPDDGVLVRVHASSLNPLDFFSLSGARYVGRMLAERLRPRPEVVGHDFAGTVESVGGRVTEFQPGDEVFGGKRGAFAKRRARLQRPLPARRAGLARQAHLYREGADDAAAHPDAMDATEEADEEDCEITGFRHDGDP